MRTVRREIELLAPGGDLDSIKAAILAGADAIYCGLNKFNARNRASNISFEELMGVIHHAHKHSCKVFLTINIIIIESEIPDLISLLNRLINTSIDAVIVQDLGLFYLLRTHYSNLEIHASTQLTTHNVGQIKFLSKLKTTRVNLSRELNVSEIRALSSVASDCNISTEVFVHGSYCLSFSGICYMSSVHGGNSGNRGRCSQPCRDRYVMTAAGKDFPLNLKDNSAYADLEELSDAGVASLKIEGRIKKFDYVFRVVKSWRDQLDGFYKNNRVIKDKRDLYTVFNRDFSNGFLKVEICKDMFIDSPRDHSIKYLSESKLISPEDVLDPELLGLYKEKEEYKSALGTRIAQIDISKEALEISISGDRGKALVINVKKSEGTFDVYSEKLLTEKGSEPLDLEMIYKRFKSRPG